MGEDGVKKSEKVKGFNIQARLSPHQHVPPAGLSL
jgi:hypothetical protein